MPIDVNAAPVGAMRRDISTLLFLGVRLRG
ncbi:hypothetical protein M218_29830 [Burkholderia pseudomallei MSHR338]|nr:hypothetical protein M218_29830 [Burkholderia pseudomallei MSHR338]